MRVLIVDDEESLLSSLSAVFGEGGGQVQTARSVPEAIAKLQSESFDAVLVDKNLPDFSGGELVKHIRERHDDLAVLLITAYATAENAKEMLNLGVDEYLEKPFANIYSVVGTVREVLKKRAQRKEAAARVAIDHLLVFSTASADRFAGFGHTYEMISEPAALSAALDKSSTATVVIDSTSFPAQETVGLVGFLRRKSKSTRIVVFSDVGLKVPLLKNLIGAGVDKLAESTDELRGILSNPALR